MVTGVTKLPWPKGRALSQSIHSSDILGVPILYSRGYSITGSSRIAMGDKGLRRRQEKISDIFHRCTYCGILFTKGGFKIHQVSINIIFYIILTLSVIILYRKVANDLVLIVS
jgi:hypothetical protein